MRFRTRRAAGKTPNVSSTNGARGASVMAQKRERGRRRRRGPTGIGGVRFHTASGLWCATVELPKGSDGRRRRRTVYAATERDAVAELQKLHADAKAGLLVDPDRITLDQYLAKWLDLADVRASTRASYGRTLA